VAQPFDVNRRTLVGEAVPVAEEVRTGTASRGGVFSVSEAGALVFQTGSSPGSELVWYDLEGQPKSTLGTPAAYDDIRLSPDGTRALASVPQADTVTRDLWMFDLASGVRTRFTLDDERPRRGAIWSPDGKWVVIATERKGHRVFVKKAANGSGAEEELLSDDSEKEPASWSLDGQFILYQVRTSRPAASP
jgi:Tol biopolymer transport system component